ncbi:MAG: helix-turn-helix domain-containing protein [Acutalibacteraceae bacterium]
MSYCKFCEVLRRLRLQHNLTQQELGKHIGLSKAVISKYENGIGYPTLDTLIHFAEYFGVTTDYLLGVEHKKMIDVTDLTNGEIESLNNIINEYRKYKNKDL